MSEGLKIAFELLGGLAFIYLQYEHDEPRFTEYGWRKNALCT